MRSSAGGSDGLGVKPPISITIGHPTNPLNLVYADTNLFENAEIADAFAWDSLTTNTWINFTLTNLTCLDKTGYTTIYLRWQNDVNATTMPWGSSKTTQIGFNMSESLVNAPTLTLEYTTQDTTPPASITNLTNSTATCEQITFDWDNPTDADFNGTEYWLNDVKGTNFTAADGSWILFGGLTGGLEYTFSTRTFDTTGNTNETFVNMTAIPTTCTPPDTTPPGPIQGLSNDTTTCEQITWGWQSPGDEDFNHTMIYRDGVFQYNLSNTTYSDVWGGLTGGQTYEFASHTVDITGNVDPDWMNQSAIVSLCGAAPVVNFTADNASVCIGDPVWFNDTSEYTPAGAYDDYFEWDFGDGNTTAGFRVDGYNAPTYNYSYAGNKTVILTVTNKYGSDNETKVDYIEVVDCSLTADFTANQTCIIGIPADIQFNSSCDNLTYKNHWDFGTGDTNNDDQNPVYSYLNYGVYNVNHTCKISTNTTLAENKLNYIIIGVNGTVCADNCTGSGGGYVGGRDEYPNYLIIGATLGLLFGLIIIRRNETK
jgi:PKD repeat protein